MQRQGLRGEYISCVEELPLQEDTLILESRNGKGIDGNIYYILQELLTNADYDGLRIYLVAEDDGAERSIRRKLAGILRQKEEAEVAPETADRVVILPIHSSEYYRVMATAKYIVNDASIGNFFIKKDGQKYLNVWHGTPLKTMGRRVRHEPHATGNVQKNFIVADQLLYPSDYMMEHMIEDYMIADLSGAHILMGGYPRNGVFFDDELRQQVRRRILMTECNQESGRSDEFRIYAYMPTWRPGLMGETMQARLEEIDGEMKEGEIMFAKIHPLAEEAVDFGALGNIRPFPDDLETYMFLNAADGLLTDYSSVLYDFANTGKTIVLLTDDEDEYFETRGLYEPLESLPFPKEKRVRDAIAALRAPKAYDDGDFLKKYCAYESAHGAEILVREFIAGETGGAKATTPMEHRSMPANGRENILVYGGDLAPGERTERVMDFLRKQDREAANYYLTFRRADLKERYDILFHLPEGVDYIGRAGTMWMTKEQRDYTRRYRKRRMGLSEYREKMGVAFALQARRNYGDMRVDRIVFIPEKGDPVTDMSLEDLEFVINTETL